MSRRALLLGASAAAVGLGLWGSLGPRAPRKRGKKGWIIGAGRVLNTETKQISFTLCVFDLEGPGSRAIDLDFFGHGLAPNPVAPRRAVLFEKRGPGCCEVDLLDGRMTRPIKTPPTRAFYGHGAFSRDGQLLYATETRLETHDGLICVRDGKTFEELGEFPTYGKNPHDCHLIDEGKTLVMTNGGGAISEEALPSVTFVEVGSTKLLEKLTFETPRINAGHLALTRSRDLVAISAPRDGLPKTALGGVTIRKGSGAFVTMKEPPEVISRMIGESLSLCIHEATGVVGVTNPDGNIVTFWDLNAERFLKKLDLPAPRGLTQTLDGEYLALGYGAGTMTLVSPETLEPVSLHRVPRSTLGGSHLFTWDPLSDSSAADSSSRG
jgi:hypothetical protein